MTFLCSHSTESPEKSFRIVTEYLLCPPGVWESGQSLDDLSHLLKVHGHTPRKTAASLIDKYIKKTPPFLYLSATCDYRDL